MDVRSTPTRLTFGGGLRGSGRYRTHKRPEGRRLGPHLTFSSSTCLRPSPTDSSESSSHVEMIDDDGDVSGRIIDR